MAPRRIVAVVLPKLACEIAKSRAEVKGPLAILLDPTFAGHRIVDVIDMPEATGSALGTHLPGGPTGHNLADLHILAR